MLDILNHLELSQCKEAPLYALLEKNFHDLEACQSAEGYLAEPKVGELSTDQYNTTFFLLSGVVLDLVSGRKQLRHSVKLALNYSTRKIFSQPTLPDNVFVLEMLVLIFRQHFPEELPNVEKISFSSNTNFHSKQSNNYFTMHALQSWIKEQFLPGEKGNEGAEAIEKSLAWLGEDFLAYDWPREGIKGERNFSLAYHSRYLFVMSLYCYLSGDRKAWSKVRRGFFEFAKFIARDGENAYYGRSLNSVYGTSNSIAAFEIFLKMEDSETFSDLKSRLESYLRDGFVLDGIIQPLQVNGFNQERMGYDEYIYDTVYRAYTVGILLFVSLLPKRPDRIPLPSFDCEVKPIEENKSTGLTFFRSGESELCFSVRNSFYTGNIIMGGLKYAAFNPLLLKKDSSDLVPTIPHIPWKGFFNTTFRDVSKSANPIYAGWMPFSRRGKEYLFPGRAEEVELKEGCDALSMNSRISCTRFSPQSSLGYLKTRVMYKLNRDFSRPPVFHSDTSLEFGLDVDFADGKLDWNWNLSGELDFWYGIRLFNSSKLWWDGDVLIIEGVGFNGSIVGLDESMNEELVGTSKGLGKFVVARVKPGETKIRTEFRW